MNKIFFQYLTFGYLKKFFNVTLIAYCFGIILNLFEEIEFLKNLKTETFLPLTLTLLYIPSMIIKLLPFIIFVSSMWFLLSLRNNRDLLSLKVFGYSNFKIFFIIAITSFLSGWFILFAINPITSTMMKYYEQKKSEYSLDLDHLVTINKNGLWIKETLDNGSRIIHAEETEKNILKNITIFNLDKKNNISNKIYSEIADINDNDWELQKVDIIEFKDGMTNIEFKNSHSIYSNYNYEKITSLFKNFDTMSFLDLALNYKELQNKGYNKSYLDQNLNSMLSMPFFLFIMTAVASILTMNTLKRSNNFTFFLVGLITCVFIYYFKDLSLALGQANRISLSLASWMPIFAIGLFSCIGILQINEK